MSGGWILSAFRQNQINPEQNAWKDSWGRASWQFLTHFGPRPPPCRPCDRAAGPASEPRPQAVREDDAGQDGAEREATPHAADVLQRQPEAGRTDEGAVGGDDRPEPQGDPGLVPEQALQRQEEVDPHEAAPAAATQW